MPLTRSGAGEAGGAAGGGAAAAIASADAVATFAADGNRALLDVPKSLKLLVPAETLSPLCNGRPD